MNKHSRTHNRHFIQPRTWQELKDALLRVFTSLKEEDLDFKEEKKADMIEALQKKLSKSKQEIISILEII
jgi:uncharacterized protein with gpF-like domain